jgi:preprotein translocase subunit SecD
MLKFSRIQEAAILITVLVICAFTVPNFVSEETISGWPDWAQRRITLAPELQGGTSALLEVDRDAVREHALASLLADVRSILRDACIELADHATIRGGKVEVRPVAGDFEAALAKLRELSRTFNGVRPVEVTDAGGGLVRLTPTEAGVEEYEPAIVNQAIELIRRRLTFVGVKTSVDREGANRLRVEVPKLGPEELFNRMSAD